MGKGSQGLILKLSLIHICHADAAGGRLTINPIEIGEQAVADNLAEIIKNSQQTATSNNTGTLADNLDPEVAAKMAQLFKK